MDIPRDDRRHEEIAAFLRSFLAQRAGSAPSPLGRHGLVAYGASSLPDSPQELAQEFLANSEFQLLRLGSWLRTPEGVVVERAVELAVGPVYRPQVRFIARALILAAEMQQRRGRQQLAVLAVAVAAVAVLGFGGAGK